MKWPDASAFEIESRWTLDATIEEILTIIRKPVSLTQWWSAVFMKAEVILSGGSDLVGLTVRFFTKGLLPHTFQFTARVVAATSHGELQIRTWGDFNGHGAVHLIRTATGADVHICWRVDVKQPYIRPLFWMAKPIFTANHRWAMRRGREGLQAEVLRRRRGATELPKASRQRPSFPHNLDAVQHAFRWTRDDRRWSD